MKLKNNQFDFVFYGHSSQIAFHFHTNQSYKGQQSITNSKTSAGFLDLSR